MNFYRGARIAGRWGLVGSIIGALALAANGARHLPEDYRNFRDGTIAPIVDSLSYGRASIGERKGEYRAALDKLDGAEMVPVEIGNEGPEQVAENWARAEGVDPKSAAFTVVRNYIGSLVTDWTTDELGNRTRYVTEPVPGTNDTFTGAQIQWHKEKESTSAEIMLPDWNRDGGVHYSSIATGSGRETANKG